MYFETKILEFDKIKQMIKRYAQTSIGKSKVEAIVPTNNELVVGRILDEVKHAYKIINEYQEPPFGGIYDCTEPLKKAKIYSILTPKEFLDIIGLIDGASNLIRFYKKVKANQIDDIALDEYFNKINQVPELKAAIQRVITVDGNIFDSASSKLQRIRNKINTNKNRINEKLNHIITTQKNRLAETFITLRSNRFVVPVKLSEKNNFKGTVVDYSSSGETVYMEPAVVNELNNEVTKLLYEEQQEIEKILRELTTYVSQHHDTLHQNFDMITTLDMIFAKAKYGLVNECNVPRITKNEVNLRKARHPLIPIDEVVANTITYKEGQKIIIITGPNTGGKTVALKTMGLLSIMVQSGMMIPIEDESSTIIFDNIFADIGDEQSIEQSLSTFSSHMTRITRIIKQLTANSLILLDELGSGTDPKEGSSLAMAILDFIREYKVFVIATTHYPELKVYAYDKEDIINASVEFDVDTLSPTYRLLLGTPGKSNALLICERLGLQRDIIRRAKDNVATSNTEVSDLINKLEHQGNELDAKIQEYERLVAEEKRLVKDNKELKSALKDKKSKFKEKAFIEKSQIVNETKEEALKLLKDIEALQKQSDIKPHQFAELKHKIKTFDTNETRTSQTTDHTYQPGDIVNVIKFNRNGELIKKIKKNTWEVKMGVLTSELKTSEFEFVEAKKISKPKSKVRSNVKKHVKGELDLRGMRYEEAKIELDRYIDQCLVANMPYASVIHGYGTLALRKMVKEHLKNHSSIQSYRDGEGGEGGSGVTIIEFK